ncbi:hypothetical protein RclHR1_15350002 [Rhizophagus clarus]|uniref:Uncharacterized protein n=1 Tax=Rhizophagus clarus TaxID=94130 RepID=A0A2Z6R7N4_9GLOM|nr:hypothetical protein RclHR1_15350002 [Rhizophagus clarus]
MYESVKNITIKLVMNCDPIKNQINVLNSDFDHMFGLVNGFCDQKSEQSELNRPNIDRDIIMYNISFLRLCKYFSYRNSYNSIKKIQKKSILTLILD